MLTRRGKTVIILTGLVIGLLTCQNYLNEKRAKEKDRENANLKQHQDSVIASGINDGIALNRKILFNDLSEALAKQNLRLDTVSKQLKSFKDSVNKTVIITNDKRPSFEMCLEGPIYEIKDRPTLTIPFCAFDDWVQIKDVNTYVILIDTFNNFHFLEKRKTPIKNAELSPTKAASTMFELNINAGLIKGFYIYLNGTYVDKNPKNSYVVDVAYYYGVNSKKFTYLVGQLRIEMINFLKNGGYW